MGIVGTRMSISLDGFVAGPNQSRAEPLGEGGMRLHQWQFATRAFQALQGREGGEDGVDSQLFDAAMRSIGAVIMGRHMFGAGEGAGEGPWDESWRGWWGEEPPFHTPVFVLTHHQREPLQMQGGTTFEFVTGGTHDALKRARAAAGERDVGIGGASVVRQYLAAGLLDELLLHIVPVLLHAGERLFEDVGDPVLEPAEVVASRAVTHVRYRVVRGGSGAGGQSGR